MSRTVIKVCLLFLFVSALHACSAPPCFCRRVEHEPPATPGMARVTFVSPKNLTQVYIFDVQTNQLVATAGIRNRMSADVAEGTHHFLIVSRRDTEVIEVNAAAGEQYYVLIRYLAVPFGPNFGVTALKPTISEWDSLESQLAETHPSELNPATLDAQAIDRAVRRIDRRMTEGQQMWTSFSPEERATRTLQPGDGVPLPGATQSPPAPPHTAATPAPQPASPLVRRGVDIVRSAMPTSDRSRN